MMTEATDKRDEALLHLERTRVEYLRRAREVAARLSNGGRRPVSVDDVRQSCPPPEGIDGRVMGAVFNTPEWMPCDYINSTRTECHGRPIRRFTYNAMMMERQAEAKQTKTSSDMQKQLF